jgi:L-ascorbate metabolism protein UlaG (beta-lactamase superfamily)
MDQLGDIDLALLPVGGWGPILGPGHMSPREAVRALKLLRPRVAVPIHWGSLVPVGLHVRAWPYLTRPPREFAALARRQAPDVKVRVLAPGASLEF